jgi:predicted nuclease of restriction endonuclease-like (RecB) superfamily
MLVQTRQIRITLAALEDNIKTLLREREMCEKVKKENEDLKKQIEDLKSEIEKLKGEK